MTIANYLTLLRLLISPIFLIVYVYGVEWGISTINLPYILLLLFFLSEFTDAFDGYLARKYNQVTDLGKILDPMADSISRITTFLAFTQPPVSLPVLLPFVLLYRDSVVSTLRTICALRGFALSARISGKIKAIIQAGAALIILALMIPHAEGQLSTAIFQQISTWTVSLAAIYTAFSGIDYIYANHMYITKLLTISKAKVLAAKSKAYFSHLYQPGNKL